MRKLRGRRSVQSPDVGWGVRFLRKGTGTMSEIDRVLRRAAWRLGAVDLLRKLVVCLTAVAGAMVFMRVAERVLAFVLDWSMAWLIAGAIGVAAALLWAYLTRPSKLGVARTVDLNAGLRETLSTALCVRGEKDAWSAAAVEHAGAVARRVVVRDAVRINVPRTWPVPMLLVGAFFLVGLLPQWDALSLLSGRTAVAKQEAEIVQVKAEVQKMDDALKEQLAKIDEKLGAEGENEAPKDPAQPTTPDDIRRDQLKKLTTIDERLNELRSTDQARAMEELQKKMEELRQPGEAAPQELKDMTQALQRGDMKAASEQLSKLSDKLSANKMSDQQKEEMKKAMENMAKQMQKLAGDQKDLERKLNEMGLDKALANNPEALKKALEAAKHLTDEQKQQAQKACEACKNAGAKMGDLAKAMQKAAQGAQGGKQGAGQQMGDLAGQLSELEMAQMKMDEIDMAQSQVQSQLQQLGQCMGGGQQPGKGGSSASNSQNWKNGPRGNRAGRANGGNGRSVEADFELNKQKIKGPNQGGPIIGSEVIEGGEQIRGEAKQAFSQAVESGTKQAAEAIESKQIPREYHEAVKNYFGRLEKKAKPAGGTPPPAPAPAEKDAAPAQPAEKK